MTHEVKTESKTQTPAETPAAPEMQPAPKSSGGHRRHLRHPLIVGAMIVILCVYGLLGLAGAALAVRLSQGPLDLAPVLPTIEKIMSRSDRLRFDIGEATLQWKGWDNPLALDMINVRLLGPMGEFLRIKSANLGLSPWRLLLAQVYFSYAEIDNLSMRVIRLPDGSLTLTGIESAPNQSRVRSVALKLNNIVNDLPAIDNLRLVNTRVIFEDQKDAIIRRFEDVDVQIEQTRGLGGRSVNGYLTAALAGDGQGSMTTVDFIYDAAAKTLSTVARLENSDTRQMLGGFLAAANLPIVDMIVQGRAEVRLNNDFSLGYLELRLQGDDGTLYWPRSYGKDLEPQKLTKFDLDVGFDPETRELALGNAEITVKGITVAANGALQADENWNKLIGDANIKVPVVAVDALPAVWPKVWDVGARHWLVDKMDRGRFAHLDVKVPLTVSRLYLPPDEDDIEIAIQAAEMDAEGETKWEIENGDVKGTFDYTGVTVDYRPPMLPARNVTGTGVFEGLSLTLDVTKAALGNLQVKKGRLYFDDLITPGKGNAELEFVLTGPVGAVFAYLEREPIAYKRKVSLDASRAQGTADVDLKVDFPTLADMRVEDVHVDAKAKLKNLSVPGVVKGLSLAGPAFDLEASENHFHIFGDGTLEGQSAKLDWAEYFSPKKGDPFSSKLEASIQTNKSIRQKFIGALEDRVDGIVPADVSLVTSVGGKGALNVTAQLGSASVDFTNPFNTIKEKGQTATAKLTGTLQDGYIQSIDSLSISGNGMALSSGNITFARDKNNEPILKTAKLRGLKLGLNDTDIDATWPSENDIKADIKGKSLDARWIMGDIPPKEGDIPSRKKTATGYDIKLTLGALYIADKPLDNTTGTFVGNTGGIIQLANLDATADGAPVTLRYSGTGGAGDRMLLEADNAGAGLAALGVTDRVRGGRLRVTGTPLEGGKPGDMTGKLRIEKFSVHKAPVLAKLINLLSLPGILNILNQDTGLTFERAEADITWLNNKGGPLLNFADGRTSGASLGLTFEGNVDMATDTMAIQGTVVPMSEVNSLISHIPLIGDILTGGNKGGGIFAATYTMKGPSADPDVTINPLSVLTPGILRRILFEGALGNGSETKP